MSTTSSSAVHFFYEAPVTLNHRKDLKRFIESMFKREKKKLASLNYIFCSDKRLLEINRQFLQHDYYTDIITFELSVPAAPVEGEIYISVDRVKDNARIHGTSIARELHRVVFHGVLHLCGFKDKSPEEEKLMRQKEEYYLDRYLTTAGA